MLQFAKKVLFGDGSVQTWSDFIKTTERSRLSDYIPLDVYDDEYKMFINDDKTFGFMWECRPLAFASESTMQSLEGIFRAGLPFGSIIQFMLYADPYIDAILDSYKKLKVRDNALLKRSAEEYTSFLKKGSKGLANIAGIPLRNYRLFVTVKMPIPKATTDLKTIGDHIDFKSKYSQINESLGGAQLFPEPVSAQGVLDLLARFFNDREFEGQTVIPYDHARPIAKQVIFSETVSEDLWNSFTVGKKIFRCVTPKVFPQPTKGVFPMQTNFLFGGIMGHIDDDNQIKTPFLYTLNIVFHDMAGRLGTKASLVMNQQAAGTFVRPLARKKEEMSEISDLIMSNTTFVRLIPIMWTWSDSENKTLDAVSRIKRCWEQNGYKMQEDKGILKPLFLSALPFGLLDLEKNIDNLERDFITPADRVAPVLPVQADFAGGGDPVLLWIGRKGQLSTLDLFNKHTTNYNGLIMAGSGGGKSVLTNYIINNYHAIGALIRIADIGGSYKKQGKMSGARYMDFTEYSAICINPFSTIIRIEEDVSILADIVLQMIYSSTSTVPHDTAETNMTSIKNAVQWAFEEEGRDADINHVYEFLNTFPCHSKHFADQNEMPGSAMELIRNECRKMAYNLSEFTTVCNGVYGKWFNGTSTFNIKNDEFVVLELEHLIPKKDLLRVVILQVLNAISQDLFLSKRDRRRFGFFDEAAQYLQKENAGGGFSPLIRMVDAAFRRARKYGGSFWVILQSILDREMLGDLGQVIDSNAAYKFYLKSNDFEKAYDKKLITCDRLELDLMKSLTTVPGKYSELYIASPIGSGVQRLVFDPFNYMVNTSSPDEVAAIEALVERGLSYEEAIDEKLGNTLRV